MSVMTSTSSLAKAAGNAPATSAKPPVFTSGNTSDATLNIFILEDLQSWPV